MSPPTHSTRRALREVAVAALLLVSVVVVVVVVGANFVLVEVRLPGIAVTTRLGWVLLAALAAGFGAGALWARR
jgi:small neutral amino acid transporter SnatA (MarC family)